VREFCEDEAPYNAAKAPVPSGTLRSTLRRAQQAALGAFW